MIGIKKALVKPMVAKRITETCLAIATINTAEAIITGRLFELGLGLLGIAVCLYVLNYFIKEVQKEKSE